MVISRSDEGSRLGRACIRVILVVVILGSLMIWIMMPTNTYKLIWQPKLRAKLNYTTYFGTQGASIVVYSFPVLLVAALSCVYLHLGNNLNPKPIRKGKKDEVLELWKGPVIVKGALGIVSGIELCLLAFFVSLLVWSFSTYLHNNFATITPNSAAKEGLQLWQSKLESAALRLGLVGNICLAFLFFPVARGSSVLPLFGLTSERSIKYHIWLGHMAMTLFTAHGLCYITFWASTRQISEMIKWEKTGISNVAGEIALVAGLFMWVAAIPRIRRKFFELFFYTHYLYIVFVFFFALHVGISYAFIMLPGFYLFLIDRYLRFLQSQQRVRLLSCRILPCDTLQLNFSKTHGLRYNPTSMMFINVPSISKLQWHPFTVTSNSNMEAEELSVVIKSEGSWSSKLYQALSSPSPVERLEVSIEGPYGPASTHLLTYETLVMVCGGSGITPFISLVKELMFITSTLKTTPRVRVVLICAFKKSSELAMLDLLLPIHGYETCELDLQIEAYVTREKEAPSTTKSSRTVWFKPHAMDSPASPLLGPNSWLWLGAIITSSFVIFLILIGIIGRYYIYPIDHNTNKIFSSASKTVLSILVMCISVGVTATAAVVWNRGQNGRESGQVQSMEGSTPAGSPALWQPAAADRELESLPQQSLVEATNVHYGARPDLKRMLLECKGESVGVIVSGPKKMRREVATICSSGLANNLHFESMSFTW